MRTEIFRENVEDQEEVTDGEPGKQHADKLIEEFNEKHRLPHEAVVTAANLVEMGHSIDSGEETSIQPAAPLENELGHAVRHIRLAAGRLDVRQNPSAVALRDNLETQDTVLGQIHVGSENTGVGTMHLFSSKVLFQRALAVLVVQKRDIAVCRKGTRQH